MRRLTKIIMSTTLPVLLVCALVPERSHAVPLRETDATLVSNLFGFPMQVATVNVQVYDTGVTSGDDRFGLLPALPGPDDFTYFYRIQLTGGSLMALTMPLPEPEEGFTTVIGAGIMENGVATPLPPENIDPTLPAPAILFDLSGVQATQYDLYIVSPFGPGNDTIFVGGLFTTTAGLVTAQLIGPDDDPILPNGDATVPEPGLLLLIGSGLLGLGVLSRRRSVKNTL